MSAQTSGSDAKSRDHNQGNQGRTFTVEQKAAVLRVRRCAHTAFYDILGLESVRATVTDAEIKKAYRKLSLLTHPDKNGHEHADEAFKMVSRAFGVLSDADKKTKYDRYGGDPDSRFGSGGGGGGGGASPFAGFASRAAGRGGGGGGVWEEEISPEEMFNRFFGGGGGFGPFGGGGFDQGPGFVFNLGGGPGFRVHQFGGGRPRRRPRDPNAPADPPPGLAQNIMQLLPLLLFLVVPMLTSLFSGSGSSTPSIPMRFDSPKPPMTVHRKTPRLHLSYYINPADVEHHTPYLFSQLDKRAEIEYVGLLRVGCDQEHEIRSRLVHEATGWLSNDEAKLEKARTMEMKHCDRMKELGVQRSAY